MLQECHILDSDFNQWKNDWELGDIYCNSYTSRSAGQVILSRGKRNILDHKIVLEGRIHLLKVEMTGAVLTLVNVYGPNKEMNRKVFLDKLQNVLISYDFGDYLIIGGDFNIVQDNSIDKYAKKIQINQNCQQTWSQKALKISKNHIDW